MLASSPRYIALTNAFIISLIASVCYGLLSLLSGTFGYVLLLVFFLILFISSYIVIKYSIDKFIFEKLRIIYQTIGKLKTKTEIKSKQDESGDGFVWLCHHL